MNDRPSCAHQQISYRTKSEGGITTGWWECDSHCGMRFMPMPHTDFFSTEDGKTLTETEWAELHRLRAEAFAPNGFRSWKDAALTERQKRIALEVDSRKVTVCDAKVLTTFSSFRCGLRIGHSGPHSERTI